MNRRLVTLATSMSLLLCAPTVGLSAWGGGPATTRAADRSELDDLRERALRDLPTFTDYRATRFIARGFTDDEEPVDPTPEFLARFNDLKPAPQPVSRTQRSGPRRDEQGRRLFWHYRDPETGERARVYYTILRERRADGDVVVDVGFTSGPLSGGGREVVYRLVDGIWTLHRVRHRYVS